MKIDDMEYWDIPSKASWWFLSDPSPIIEMLGLWSDQKYNKILQDGDSGFISPEQQGAGVTTTTGDLLNSANLLDFNKKEDGE